MQVLDQNRDGHFDILFSNTYTAAYLLINTGESIEKPVFRKVKYIDFEKKNHGMMCGGGDWTGDGVADWLYMPFGGAQYKVFEGSNDNGMLSFKEGPLKNAKVLKFKSDKTNRAVHAAWAWNYTGQAKNGDIEYVGVDDRGGKTISFFKIENGESRKVGDIVMYNDGFVSPVVSDLNGDGKPDILYGGSAFGDKSKTKIYVLWGKKTVKGMLKSTGGNNAASGDLKIIQEKLPNGKKNESYEFKLEAVGGQPPYQWRAIIHPSGMKVSDDGVITGTPRRSGRFKFKLKLKDAEGEIVRKTLQIEIVK